MAMEIIESVLQKIDELRIKNGLSIFKLTQLAELSENTIYNWYNKGAVPSLKALISISNILDISLSDLFSINSEEVFNHRQKELVGKLDKLSGTQQKLVLAMVNEFETSNS